MTECPVCDVQVDDTRAIAQGLYSEFEGVPYYFCSSGCKEQFDRDPMYFARQMNGRYWPENVEQNESELRRS